MPGHHDDDYEDRDLEFFGPPRPDERFISYTLPPGQRIGGMKVRYVLRVVSGDRAKEIDARQAKAIMEVLEWIRHHPSQAGQPGQQRRNSMMTPVNDPGKSPEIHEGNLPGMVRGPRIISYNLNEDERPGGLKVRFKIRIETGKKAAALNAQQAEAIRELLQWASQHQTPPRH